MQERSLMMQFAELNQHIMNSTWKSGAVIVACMLVLSCAPGEDKPPKAEAQKNDSANKKKFDATDMAYPRTARDSAILFSYTQLASALPPIAHFRKAAPSGESYSGRTSGGVQSYVKQEYSGASGNTIMIEMVDYGVAPKVLRDLMKMYSGNVGAPNTVEVWSKQRIDSAEAFVVHNAGEKRVTLITEVNGRFYLNLTSNGITDITRLRGPFSQAIRNIRDSLSLKKVNI